MKRGIVCMVVLFVVIAVAPALPAAEPTPAKVEAVQSVERNQAELVDISDQVWAFAETALREHRSAALLADFTEAHGFTVQRGVAGMPTAFVASYGSGRPVIGILGEYDALPGLSQKAQPTKAPLVAGAPGHGCGHNLLGTASLGAALAIKELIAAGTLRGTIRYYGTPAEEAVGGKLYMVRAGLFDDVDVVMAWHPSDEIEADTDSSQAMADVMVRFEGKTAHAAADPWNGRSALDAVEVFTTAVNLMREHVKPTVRMHYVIPDGGDVPNVVPDHASVWIWFRDSKHDGVDDLLQRARDIAEGAALATGTTSTFTVQSGDWETLTNFTGAKLLHGNLEWLGPLQFTDEEQEFARTIQRETGTKEEGLKGAVKPLDLDPGPPKGGSTDVADVSWQVPTINLSVTTAAADAPWHAWPVVATGGSSIGHKGMLYAAKAMAATMVDLYQQPDELAAIQKEFKEKTEGVEYHAYLPEGPPPIPKD